MDAVCERYDELEAETFEFPEVTQYLEDNKVKRSSRINTNPRNIFCFTSFVYLSI